MENKDINNTVDRILNSYTNKTIDDLDVLDKPNRDEIVSLLNKLISIMYYGYMNKDTMSNHRTNLTNLIKESITDLKNILVKVLPFNEEYKNINVEEKADELTLKFFNSISDIRDLLEQDLEAIYCGDPAASNMSEIIISYPGFYAISVYRIAHELFKLNIPMVPRVMSERAHSKTGIDIHPGATIGHYFFIDHGTGIVVGETTVIGNHVKLYQGVTLGALSTSGGQSLKGTKRHPTIKDNVTIYSNASVLGNITIGNDCVIGGNVFVTKDVPDFTTVFVTSKEQSFKKNI